jgi:hypothetical protein
MYTPFAKLTNSTKEDQVVLEKYIVWNLSIPDLVEMHIKKSLV